MAGLHIDPARLWATGPDGREIGLGTQEWRVVLALLRAARPVSSRTLYDQLYVTGGGINTNAVTAIIYRLQKKLGPNWITFGPGGYVWNGPRDVEEQ